MSGDSIDDFTIVHLDDLYRQSPPKPPKPPIIQKKEKPPRKPVLIGRVAMQTVEEWLDEYDRSKRAAEVSSIWPWSQ